MKNFVALVAICLCTLVLLGLRGETGVNAVQGDQLGPDSYETRQGYTQRAHQLLNQALDSPDAAGLTTYAMVTFSYPVDPAHAAGLAAPLGRVSGIISSQAGFTALPEPVAGASRAEVFSQALSPEDGNIVALVAYDTPVVLASIAREDQVLAVEPAPVGAAYGSFSIKPPIFLHR